MYLIVIGWLYVAVMMAVAEANHPAGTVLGAIVTFLLYGLLPTALVVYVMGTPLRRKARLAQEAGELAGTPAVQAQSGDTERPSGTDSSSAIEPNTSGHATGGAQSRSIPPV